MTDPILHEYVKVFVHIGSSRWSGGASCPHSDCLRVRQMEGRTPTDVLLYKDCRDKFTVRDGTVMERSHVPLHKLYTAELDLCYKTRDMVGGEHFADILKGAESGRLTYWRIDKMLA